MLLALAAAVLRKASRKAVVGSDPNLALTVQTPYFFLYYFYMFITETHTRTESLKMLLATIRQSKRRGS